MLVRRQHNRLLDRVSNVLRALSGSERLVHTCPVAVASNELGASIETDADDGSPPTRTHLMMINGVVTGREGQISSAAHRQPVANSSIGSQLLMSKDGQVTRDTPDAEESSESDSTDDERFSFEHPDSQLFEAALKHVAEHGWSIDAVRRGAQDLGLSQSAAAKFERPEASLVAYFVDRCNYELAQKLKESKHELAGMKTQEIVRTAVQWRLEMQIPYMENWSQALAIRTSPGSLPSTMKQVSRLVDEIWYACGDSSADLSWYTKRATLAGVYAATEAHMLTDYSPGYSDTWEALDRSIQDVAALGKLRKKAQETATGVLNSAFSLFQQTIGKREAF